MAEYNLSKIIGRLQFGKAHDQNQGVKTVPQSTEETSLWPQALFYSEFSSSFHHTQEMKQSKNNRLAGGVRFLRAQTAQIEEPFGSVRIK